MVLVAGLTVVQSIGVEPFIKNQQATHPAAANKPPAPPAQLKIEKGPSDNQVAITFPPGTSALVAQEAVSRYDLTLVSGDPSTGRYIFSLAQIEITAAGSGQAAIDFPSWMSRAAMRRFLTESQLRVVRWFHDPTEGSIWALVALPTIAPPTPTLRATLPRGLASNLVFNWARQHGLKLLSYNPITGTTVLEPAIPYKAPTYPPAFLTPPAIIKPTHPLPAPRPATPLPATPPAAPTTVPKATIYVGFAPTATDQDIQKISDKYNLQLTALGTTGLKLAVVDADHATAVRQLLSDLPLVACVADSQAACAATLSATTPVASPAPVTTPAPTAGTPPTTTTTVPPTTPPATVSSAPVLVDDSLPPAGQLSGKVTVAVGLESTAGPLSVTFVVSGPLGTTPPMAEPAQASASDPTKYTASHTWDSSGVADGTYTLQVTATDASGKTATTQRVYRIQNAAPTSPTQLAAAPSTAGVALSWQQPAVAQAKVYRLFRDDSDLTQAFGGLAADERSFIDSLALAGLHHYRLILVDKAEHESQPATVSAIVPSDSRPAATPALIGLTLISPSGDPLARGGLVTDRLELRAQQLPVAARLTFQYSTDNQSWRDIPVAASCSDVCRATWQLSGASAGHYLVRARAADPLITSLPASFVFIPSASSSAPPPAAVAPPLPSAPSTVWAIANGATVRLDWAPAADPSATFNVYRVDPGGNSLVLAASRLTQPSFIDSGLNGGQTYGYVVTANNSAGQQSGFSAPIWQEAGPAGGPKMPVFVSPSAAQAARFAGDSLPLLVSVIADAGMRSVNFAYQASGASSWTDLPDGLPFNLPAAQTPELGAPGGSTWAATWNTGSLAPGQYVVRALVTDAAGQTVQQTKTVRIDGASSRAPPVTINLQATPIATGARLTWTSTGGTEFQVLRSALNGSGPFEAIGTTSSLEFLDRDLIPATAYRYQVVQLQPSLAISGVVEAVALAATDAAGQVRFDGGMLNLDGPTAESIDVVAQMSAPPLAPGVSQKGLAYAVSAASLSTGKTVARFDHAASLTLPLDAGSVGQPGLAMYQWDPLAQTWNVLPSTVDASTATVTAPISGSGVFAVGAGTPRPAEQAHGSALKAGAVEVREKWTRTTRVYRNPDGTMTTQLFGAAVNYVDPQGNWQIVDSTLVPSADGTGWHNKSNAFDVELKQSLAGDYQQIMVNGKVYGISLDGATPRTGQTLDPASVSYSGIFPGVGLTDSVTGTGLDETLVLSNATAPDRYRFRLSVPAGSNLQAVSRPDGSWAFFDGTSTVPAFVLNPASAYERPVEPGELSLRAGHATMLVARLGQGFAIDVAIDRAWLRDPARRFPVFLDPSLTIQTDQQDAYWHWNVPTDGPQRDSQNFLHIGDSDSHIDQASYQFDLSVLPAGASITQAQLGLYYNGYCISTTVHCGQYHTIEAHRMTSAWNSTSTTTSQLTYDTTALSSVQINLYGANQWYYWDVTAAAQNWYSGAWANNGLLLLRNPDNVLGVSGPVIPSRNWYDGSITPQLSVTWTANPVTMTIQPDLRHASFPTLNRYKLVQQISAAESGASFAMAPVSVTGGNRLILVVENPLVNSVTDNYADSWTRDADFLNTANNQHLSVWSTYVSTSRSTTVTIANGNSSTGTAVLQEWSGLSEYNGAAVDVTSWSVNLSSGATAPTRGSGELALGIYGDIGANYIVSATTQQDFNNTPSASSPQVVIEEQNAGPAGSTPNSSFTTGVGTAYSIAATIVYQLGSNSGVTSGLVQQTSINTSGSTVTLPTLAGVTPGNRLVLIVGSSIANSVTDSANNSWQRDADFVNTGNGMHLSYWSAYAPAGGNTTVSVSTNGWNGTFVLQERSGLSQQANAVDVSVVSYQGGTSPQSGGTAPTTAAGELALGAYLDAGANYVVTGLQQQDFNNSPSTFPQLVVEEQNAGLMGHSPNSSYSSSQGTAWVIVATVVYKVPVNTGISSNYLWIGSATNQTYRGAVQFDLGQVPAGVQITQATLGLYYDGHCVAPTTAACANSTQQLDVYRIYSSWTASSTTSQIAYAPELLSSYSLVMDTNYRWMTWDVTSVMQQYECCGMYVYGFYWMRNPETSGAGGPAVPSPFSGDTSRAPRLVITYNPQPPTAPLNVTGSPADSTATVSWSPPQVSGGAPISSYTVTAYNASGQPVSVSYNGGNTTHVLVCGTCTSVTLGGLSNGYKYQFGVIANTVAGAGPEARSAWVIMPPAISFGTISPNQSVYAVGQVITLSATVSNYITDTSMSINNLISNSTYLAAGGGPLTYDGSACSATSTPACTFNGTTLTVGALSLNPSSSHTITYQAVLQGLGIGCQQVPNPLNATNAANVTSHGFNRISICDSGLGIEKWWTYIPFDTGPQSMALVNVANGNLVVQQTDTTPIQAHGSFAYVLRRTYNSQDTGLLPNLPGQFGKGWQLNIDDLSGGGIGGSGLIVPNATLETIANPLSVTLTDRDGTRHVFTFKGFGAGMSALDLNVYGGTGALLPVSLGISSTRSGDHICVDQNFQAPPGVHLGLWRYIEITPTGGATCQNPQAGSPVLLGFAAERPDRIRYEFSADGHMLDMRDGNGVDLRYSYLAQPVGGIGWLPNTALGPLTAIYEARSCNDPFQNPKCRAFRFTYNGLGETDVSDPANRVTRYILDVNGYLTKVINPDGSKVTYTYCNGVAGLMMQLCSMTDPNGGTTTFTYGSAGLGPNQVTGATDRRGVQTTISYQTGSATFDGNFNLIYQLGSAYENQAGERHGFYNIDGSGRVRERDDGVDVNNNWEQRTFTYWDGDYWGYGCRRPDAANDNNPCEIWKPAFNTQTQDQDTKYVFNDEGQLLNEHRVIPNALADEETTYGYHAQYFEDNNSVLTYDDTVRGGGDITTPGPRGDAHTLFAISDKTQMLSPRGNTPNAAYDYVNAYAADEGFLNYLTSYVVDSNSAFNPNAIPSATTCNYPSRPTANTGNVCEVDGPAFDGVHPTVTRYTYNTFGERITMTTPKEIAENPRWSFLQSHYSVLSSGINGAGTGGTTLSDTFGTPVTAGNRVIVAVSLFSSSGTRPAVTTVSGSNGSFFKLAGVAPNGDARGEVSVWSAVASATGTYTVTVNTNVASDIALSLTEYSGLSTASNPVDVQVAGTGNSATPSSAATSATTAANEMVLSVYGDMGGGKTMSAGSAYTGRVGYTQTSAMIQYQTGTIVAFLEDQDSGPNGSTASCQWISNTGNNWACLALIFKLASAPPPPTWSLVQTHWNVLSNGGGTATTANTDALASPVTANNRILTVVSLFSSTPNATITGLSGSSGSFTRIAVAHPNGLSTAELSVWTVVPSVSGTYTITATASAASDIAMTSLEYTGLAINSALLVDVQSAATGTTMSPASGATAPTTGTNELVLGVYGDTGGTKTMSSGSGYSSRANYSPTSQLAAFVEDASSGASGATPNATWSSNASNSWAAMTLALRPAPQPYVYTYYSDGTQANNYTDCNTDLSGTVCAGGWLKGVTDPNGNFVAFAYDAGGNVTRTWDRNATRGYTLFQFPGTVSSPTNSSYSETLRAVPNSNYLAGRLTNQNDSIFLNARQLTSGAPTAESGSASTIGTATGWGELYSQGNAAAWAALPAAPSPSAHGWLMDSTQLEGNTIQAGTWNVQMKLGLSTSGSVTADLHVRAWRYASSSVWTVIGDFTQAAVPITSAPVSINYNGSGIATDFNVGDKLYLDVLLNVTANTAAAGAAITIYMNNAPAGEQVVSPGYVATNGSAFAPYLTNVSDVGSGLLGLPGRQLTTSGGNSESSSATTVGTATGYGEIFAQGNGAAWPAGGVQPNPTGNGWVLDSTLLEGQTIESGAWPINAFKFGLSTTGIVTADIHVRAFKRSGTGVYTMIVDAQQLGAAITNANPTFNFRGTTSVSTAFGVGDKLYVDAVLNITSNTALAGATISAFMNNINVGEGIATPGRKQTSYTPYSFPWRYVTQSRTPDGNITDFGLDADGNVTRTTPPRGYAAGTNAYDIIQTFDAAGNLLTRQLPAEASVGKKFTHVYDNWSNVTSVQDPDGNYSVTQYDDLNRPIHQVTTRGLWPSDITQVPAGCRQSTSSDAPIPAGRILCSTTTTYDSVNNPISITDASGQTSQFIYDAFHRKTQQLVPRNDGSITSTQTSFIYDADGNVTDTCSPRDFTEGGSTGCVQPAYYSQHVTYDFVGRPAMVTTYRQADQAQASTTDIITNGSFESGMTGWTVGGTPTPNTSTAQAHSGSNSAVIGPTTTAAPNQDPWIYQTVTIPQNTTKATLSFWFWPHSDTYGNQNAYQEAYITDASGSWIEQVMGADLNAQTWTPDSFDMTKFAGQTVRIYFDAQQDNNNDKTYMYLDDVSLKVQTATRSEAVQSGGFENGSTGWWADGVTPPHVTSDRAHSGTQSAVLGWTTGPEPEGDSTMRQTVTIPATATRAILNFWYLPSSTDTGSDRQEVWVLDTNLNKLAQVLYLYRANSQAWVPVGYDMSQFIGKTVVLWFNVHGYQSTGLTSMYVDDVSLTYVSCSTASGPAATCTTPGPNTLSASTTTFGYDADGNRISVTDPNGNTVTDAFDYLDRRVSETKPRDVSTSNTTNWNYDPAGNVTSVVQPGNLITAMSYDVNERPVDTVQGSDNLVAASAGLVDTNGGSNVRSRVAYDRDGHVVATFDPRAFASSTSTPDATFMHATDVDVNGRPITVYSPRYDSSAHSDLGLSSTQTSQCPTGAAPQAQAYPSGVGACVTGLTYDWSGQRHEVLLPTGDRTVPTYVRQGTFTIANSFGPQTFSQTGSASDLALIGIALGNGGQTPAVTGITDNGGNTWTLIGEGVSANSEYVDLWAAYNIRAFTSITVTFGGSPTYGWLSGHVGYVEYSHVGGLDASATASSYSTTSQSVSTSGLVHAGELAVSVMGFWNNQPTATGVSPGYSWIDHVNSGPVSNDNTLDISDITSTTTGVQTASWTTTNAVNSGQVIATFKASNNRYIAYNYTDDHLLLSVDTPDPSSNGNRIVSISYLYDADGRPVKITDALGHVKTISYFADGLTNQVCEPPNGSQTHCTSYRYDANGNQIAATDARGLTSQSTYYADNKLADIRDAVGHDTHYTYDLGGRTTSVCSPSCMARDATNPLGLSTTYSYYQDNLLQWSKQPFKSDGSKYYLTTYGYDAAGRKTSQDTKWVDVNNVTVGTDPGAQTFTYYNDGRGNTQTGRGGSGTITHSYDPAGNVKTATDSTGGGSTITSTFYLDSKPRTVDNGTKTNKYCYDGAGQTAARADVTDVGGATASTTTYAFGDAEVPTSMTASAPAGTTSWINNQAGQQTRENDPNGQYTTFNYNPDNSLSQKVLYNSSNAVLNSWTYTYDALNHIVQQTTPSLTTYYQYDSANRVCYYSTTTAQTGCSPATFTYDADGNRLTAPGQTFTYNADGSMNNVNGGTPFSYTAFQAVQNDGQAYAYDGHDRMSAAGTSSYQYDALDRQRSSNGTAVNYDGFSQTPAIETVSGSDRIYALDPFGQPKAVQSASGSEYLTDDGHGNIATITNGTQSVTCSTKYDPWGAPPSPQTTPCASGTGTQDDLFYRSFRRDATNGTYQFGSRIYDPTKAGFLSSDVYRTGSPSQNQGLQLDPLTQDRYNYVNGDPVNLVDFDGHKVCAQGDPNPDCDTYRQGTTYKGWKDQAYYDNQEANRQKANREAAVRYAKSQEAQKREAERHKNDCSLNPFDKNSCEARAVSNVKKTVQDAGTFLDSHMKDINKWSGKIAMACGTAALFTAAVPVVGELVGGCAVVAGLVNVASDLYLLNKAPDNQKGALAIQTGLDALSTIPGFAPLRGPARAAARVAEDAFVSAQGARTLSGVARFFGDLGAARDLRSIAALEEVRGTFALARAESYARLATVRDWSTWGVGLVGYEYGEWRDGKLP